MTESAHERPPSSSARSITASHPIPPLSANVPLAGPPHPATTRAITVRSVSIGLIFVCIAAGLQPFNDYIATNTNLIGSYLPVVVVLLMLALVIGINAPLHRFAARAALSHGELTVVLAMLLIGCSVPAFIRPFVPSLVAPFWFGHTDAVFWRAFEALHLPSWLFPVGEIAEGRRSEVVSWFYGRIEPGQPIPLGAWMVPLAGWGVFVFAMFASLFALALLTRYQWAENERLPFPLATVEAMLVEPPARGRALNPLFRSGTFWAAAAAVVVVQSLIALHEYLPKHVPTFPLSYSLREMLADPPWSYIHVSVRQSQIFFTFIGITYFIQSRVAFSLWAIFLAQEVVFMQLKVFGLEITDPTRTDQGVGATVAFLVGILWIGRQHWLLILRQALLPATNNDRQSPEARRDFSSYRWTFLVLVACVATMIGWLIVLGVRVWVAGGIVGFLLMAHLVVSRVVAQTGLPFIRSYSTFASVYTALPASTLSGRDAFFSATFTPLTQHPTRESTLTFTLHALQVCRLAGAHDDSRGLSSVGARRGVVALGALALIVAFAVTTASYLWFEYNYATPITTGAELVVNKIAVDNWPQTDVVAPFSAHAQGKFAAKPHDPWKQMGIGFGVTMALQLGSWRWAAWPLAPVGYLVSSTWYLQQAWLSILLGWAAKVLIVRFGGAKLYDRARPAFVGLIVGEALAAGLWLVINLLVIAAGHNAKVLRFLPS